MTSLVSSPPVPSELDDEVDDADPPSGHAWAYRCKLPSCPDYGKSWNLRSNFLLHLQKREAPDGVRALLRCSAAAAMMAVVITVPRCCVHTIEGHGLRCEIRTMLSSEFGVADRLNNVLP